MHLSHASSRLETPTHCTAASKENLCLRTRKAQLLCTHILSLQTASTLLPHGKPTQKPLKEQPLLQ
jgi:hypothetical protein